MHTLLLQVAAHECFYIESLSFGLLCGYNVAINVNKQSISVYNKHFEIVCY